MRSKVCAGAAVVTLAVAAFMAAAPARPVAAASLEITDAVGDADAHYQHVEGSVPQSWRWDIVEASLDAPASGRLRVTVRMQPFTPPPGPSGLVVEIRPTDPSVPTSRLSIGANGYAFLQPGNPDLECTPLETADATSATYSVVVDANCIFNPAAVQFRASSENEGVDPNVGAFWIATDAVPDVVGGVPQWSPVIVNDAHGVLPPPPPRVGAGQVLKVHVLGEAGVPASGVAAVAMNVTVDRPLGPGFVTVYPCDAARPLASNVNFEGSQTVANAVIAPVSAAGDVCFYVDRSSAHLLADVSGWFEAGTDYHPLVPVRVFDTRDGTGGVAARKVRPDAPLEIDVRGRGGVPAAGVTAVALNVTATEPEAAGFITTFRCAGGRPWASNLNYRSGQTVANAMIVPVPADGRICFYAEGTTHLVADVNGWFAEGATFHPVGPQRVFDTRDGTGGLAPGKVAPGTYERPVTGMAGVPAEGVAAVSYNVTVVDPDAAGYITGFPCGEQPLTSNVNFAPGQIVANAVLVPVSASGSVCFTIVGGATHLVVDVNGWFGAGSSFHPLVPRRLFDTRTGEVPTSS